MVRLSRAVAGATSRNCSGSKGVLWPSGIIQERTNSYAIMLTGFRWDVDPQNWTVEELRRWLNSVRHFFSRMFAWYARSEFDGSLLQLNLYGSWLIRLLARREICFPIRKQHERSCWNGFGRICDRLHLDAFVLNLLRSL